jgi:hypothetical protein
MLFLSTKNIVADRAKNVRTLLPPKKQKKDPYFENINCGLFAHPISQHVYWSGFVLGGSSCCSGREAVSQYCYGARICGGCGGGRIYSGNGGDRAGFIRVSTIIHSLPTCRNGFHCLSSNRRVHRWSVPC